MLLAEANQSPSDVRPYFGDGDECHMAFHFPVMPRLFMALHLEERDPIVDIMEHTPNIPDTCQWALFLRNHDELTLEMVTDDERDYMYLAYSADPMARLNVGIRRRLAPLMNNSRRRIELLTSVLFSLPGTPIIYYGDEIGMGDNMHLGDRNGVRTPMQWTGDRNAGFSRADPQQLFSPVISDPVYGYQAVNVEAEEHDGASLLHWTRNMIRLRRLFRVFGRGTIEFLQPANRAVLAYVRRYEEDDAILCVANLARNVQPVHLDLGAFAGLVPSRDAGVHGVSRHRRRTVLPDAWPLWLLLVRAPASRPLRPVRPARRRSSSASRATTMPTRLGACVRSAREGIRRHARTGCVILADGASTDRRVVVAREVAGDDYSVVAVDYRRPTIDPLKLPYHGRPGRAAAMRAVLRAARDRAAKACVMLDAGLTNLRPEAVESLVEPVLSGQMDYVSAHYVRHPYEGAMTKSVVYPVFRALYGARLRQPAALEFACSAPLLDHFLAQRFWDAEEAPTGIDMWLAAGRGDRQISGRRGPAGCALGARPLGRAGPQHHPWPARRRAHDRPEVARGFLASRTRLDRRARRRQRRQRRDSAGSRHRPREAARIVSSGLCSASRCLGLHRAAAHDYRTEEGSPTRRPIGSGFTTNCGPESCTTSRSGII